MNLETPVKAGQADSIVTVLPRTLPAVAEIMMLLGNWDHDPEDDFEEEMEHKELRQSIKWTGPSFSPMKALLDVVPTEAEIKEHQRALNEAASKYIEEQLRKLPLLAQECGIDTPSDAWVGIFGRNDVWVLHLLLDFARQRVPGFRLDFGSRRGARKWNEGAQAELIADIEAVKHRWREQRRSECGHMIGHSFCVDFLKKFVVGLPTRLGCRSEA